MKKVGKITQDIIIPKCISQLKDKVKIEVWAKPNAKESKIVSISDDEISVQINAPPREGEANQELKSYLSLVLSIKESQIGYLGGQKSKTKILYVEGLEIEQVYKKLLEASKEN